MSDQVIVVGVTGTPDGVHALHWALHRAERTGAPVKAVMSWRYPSLMLLPSPIGLPVPPIEAMDEATADALAELVTAATTGSSVEVAQVIGQGATPEVLLREAEGAQLLVVGSRGRGRLGGIVLGSVSRRVAALAPCPVAVVPEGAAIDADGPVVVGVDGSPGSLAALRWAAAATDGPIHVVHAYEHPFGPEYVFTDLTVEDAHRMAEAVLEQSVREALGDRSDVTTEAVLGDARAVLAEEELGASMIVVGARGATGLEGLVLGSVATDLTARPSSVVVIVPA